MKTEYRGEVWQNGMKQAAAQGATRKRVEDETLGYALQYAQDGPVLVKFFRKLPKQRWKRLWS